MRKEQVTIRLPLELKEIIQREASKRGYTMTNFIIFIILDYVNKKFNF